MHDTDLLLHLGIDPDALDPAPEPKRGPDRVGLAPVACALCGQPAQFTRIVDVDRGPCWLDRCRRCFLATVGVQPSRVPATAEGIVADLRAAMAELTDHRAG